MAENDNVSVVGNRWSYDRTFPLPPSKLKEWSQMEILRTDAICHIGQYGPLRILVMD